MEDNIEDDIYNKDTLDKLYKLFEGIEKTIVGKKNSCSYKTVRDCNNIFIMIDQKSLQKILMKLQKS
jgi:hypothetical protein